jgi:hypothetical protein
MQLCRLSISIGILVGEAAVTLAAQVLLQQTVWQSLM